MHVEALKKWMNNQGFSIQALADRMDVSYSLVASILNGSKPITNGFRWKFGQVFGFEVAQEMLGDDYDETVKTAQEPAHVA